MDTSFDRGNQEVAIKAMLPTEASHLMFVLFNACKAASPYDILGGAPVLSWYLLQQLLPLPVYSVC